MKILYFTFITPTERFGGGIGALQSLYSLCSFADVDYVGPEFQINEFEEYGIKPKNVYIIMPIASKTKRICNLLAYGVSTGFYEMWKKVITSIDIRHYDCVYLDYARQDFVVKWAKKYNLPIIVRAHNVEADYFSSLFENHRSLFSYFHKKIGKKSERSCISLSNKVIALTLSDKKRLMQLYGNESEHYSIVPVCVKHFKIKEKKSMPEPFISITGSLWFGPNASGTEWFLDQVWRNVSKEVSEKFSLVIAGASPNTRIKELANELSKVYIYENPEDIDAYYQQASIYVAPVFYGAGMKVKIAEALSCGLPVITTYHAIAGYEAMKSNIWVGDTAQDFLKHLEFLSKKSKDEMEIIRKRINMLFENNYSLIRSSGLMEEVVKDVIED